MTKEELDEIRRIWAAAAPGPWQVMSMPPHECNGMNLKDVVVYEGTVCACVACDVSEVNATAIAAAPTHIAKLIAEVETLHGELEQHGRCDNCNEKTEEFAWCIDCVNSYSCKGGE